MCNIIAMPCGSISSDPLSAAPGSANRYAPDGDRMEAYLSEMEISQEPSRKHETGAQ
jgi:hypothetical protein